MKSSPIISHRWLRACMQGTAGSLRNLRKSAAFMFPSKPCRKWSSMPSLAAEDQNFYEHNGIDFRGVARAVFNNLTRKKREGASTITQQVAKNFLLSNEQTFIRKAKEAILAIRIDRAFTKDQILGPLPQSNLSRRRCLRGRSGGA